MQPQFAQHPFTKHRAVCCRRVADAVSLALLLWVLLLVGIPARAQANSQWDNRFGPPPAGLGANGLVYALLTHPDGSIYAAGQFTQVGSVAANNIARWDPATGTWSALGSGLTIAAGTGTPEVVAMDVDAAGKIYVAGRFDEAGGNFVRNVAMWDPATQQWSSLGTGDGVGVNTNVQGLAVGGNGFVYIGASTALNEAGGVTVRQTAQWDPSTQTWSPVGTVGTGGSGVVRRIIADKNSRRVYYVGSFTNFPGSSQSVSVGSVGLAVWNADTSAWSALGQGVVREGESSSSVGNIYAGRVDADGNFYLGGAFTHAIQPNGTKIAANRIAKWNPSTQQWSAIGGGIAPNGTTSTVPRAFLFEGNNLIVA
ncbi:MAG: hypothetical protein ACOYL7_15285, partial [Caldilinea sp.]